MVNNKLAVPAVALLAVLVSSLHRHNAIAFSWSFISALFTSSSSPSSSSSSPLSSSSLSWNDLSLDTLWSSFWTNGLPTRDWHFWSWTLLFFVVLYVALHLYEFFFVVKYWRKTFQEAEHDLVKTDRQWRTRTKVKGPMPPPYPNGWFFICFSQDLKPGQVLGFEYLGQHFVAFRGKNDGKAAVMDAFCPHLGANLGINGIVRDDCLECPFHGWSFSGDGKCVSIPYAEKVPETAKLKTWPTLECNGTVMIWHHAEGVEPEWFPPEIEGITKGYYRFHGNSIHEVRAHIQEIPENGPDTAHLNILHKPFIGELFGLEESVFNHAWEADWTVGKGAEQHIAHLRVKEDFLVFGKKFPGLTIDVQIQQIGPGLVQLHFATPVGTAVICQSVTPLAPTLQRVTHSVYSSLNMPRCVAKFILRGTVIQFERDVPIWNNKKFLNKPFLIKEDGKIAQFRRWFSKFYSEHSEKMGTESTSLDW